jgi:hypothetical protein
MASITWSGLGGNTFFGTPGNWIGNVAPGAADLAVITAEGVVGKILAIFPHSAQVLLLTDPSSGVGVTLSSLRIQYPYDAITTPSTNTPRSCTN